MSSTSTSPDQAEPERKLLAVRATVHLSGLSPGQTVWVDPADSYIGELLELQYLVPLQVAEPADTVDAVEDESS